MLTSPDCKDRNGNAVHSNGTLKGRLGMQKQGRLLSVITIVVLLVAVCPVAAEEGKGKSPTSEEEERSAGPANLAACPLN